MAKEKKIIITHEIREALKRAVDATGRRSSFVALISNPAINAQYINNWLGSRDKKPRANGISESKYNILLPYIQPHLDAIAKEDSAKKVEKEQKKEYIQHKLNENVLLKVPLDRTVIAGGIFHMHGTPNDRITSVIMNADFLTEDQKKELIYQIFKGE